MPIMSPILGIMSDIITISFRVYGSEIIIILPFPIVRGPKNLVIFHNANYGFHNGNYGNGREMGRFSFS